MKYTILIQECDILFDTESRQYDMLYDTESIERDIHYAGCYDTEPREHIWQEGCNISILLIQ